MNYIFSKRKPKVGDRGFIIGDRFVQIAKESSSSIPKKGLIFYDSLSKSHNVTESGFPVYSFNGTERYQIYQDIPCCLFDGSSSISYDFKEIDGNKPCSISLWMNRTNYTGNQLCVFGMGQWAVNTLRAIVSNYSTLTMEGGTDFPSGGYTTKSDEWIHVCAIFPLGDNGKMAYQMYVNANQVINTDYVYSLSTVSVTPNLCIGKRSGGNPSYFNGYISSVRIYNRVLTEDEIIQLSKEFKIN